MFAAGSIARRVGLAPFNATATINGRPFPPSLRRPRRSAISTSTMATASPAGPLPESIAQGLVRVATGVPLVETFQMLTVGEAALRSTLIIACTAAIVLCGNRMVTIIGDLLSNFFHLRGARDDGTLAVWQMLGDGIKAAERPACVLLPLIGSSFCCVVLAAFGEVALSKSTLQSATTQAWALHLVNFLKDAAQLMQDASEILVILFTAWFFLNFKRRIVERIVGSEKLSSHPTDNGSLARIVNPISTLVTWATVVAATLCSLSALGINVQPLLALGSVSTIAVGFAAQSTVSNVLCAFALYASRPFIAGDRVTLRAMSGSTVVAGTVETIAPMHTVIRTDPGTPIFIHNKDIATSLLVVNESKVTRENVTPALPVLDATLTIRYQDVDAVPAIQRAGATWLKSHPDLMPGMPQKFAMQGFDLYGVVMSVKATLNRDADSRKSEIFMELLTGLEKIVREHGAFLAVEEGVMLPPPLSIEVSLS